MEYAMRSLTWQEVWGRRLARHALLAPAPTDYLVEVARTVCGIHAQMLSAAELSIGIRVLYVTQREVLAQLWQRRGLVKTYGPRGTIHLFPADEVSLWSAALQANQHQSEARRLAQMGLQQSQLEALVAAIGDALDGRCLTREELGVEVARRTGSWAVEAASPAFGGQWPRWLMALGTSANAGVLCFGPDQGSKVTFVRPDQWLGGWAEVDGAAALREVLRRYLSAYGPATYREFAQWFGMQPSRARALMGELASELEEVTIEGYHAWMLADEVVDTWPPAQASVCLLPHFDCYLIGCHPRERLVPANLTKRVLTRGAIGNLPLLVINGVVAGLWQQRRIGRRLEVVVEPLQSLSQEQHEQLQAVVARIGEVVEMECTLVLGAVDARPHR
jgi:Winged helix DNA-binding domain